MAVEREEFKFPDEVEAEREAQRQFHKEQQGNQQDTDDIQIEIEDDTPLEDRNRNPMPKEVVNELESDDLDEYSDKVKKRLSQMKKVWHDERREKEKALREREEALKFAEIREQEIRQLKQRVGNGEKALVAEATKAANNHLLIAKDKFKQAYEAGDPDRIAEAQQEITAATLRINEINRYRPNSLQNEDLGVDNPQQVQAPPRAPAAQVDSRASTWQQANPWFGTNKAMTAFALGLHDELTIDEGLDPTRDAYYARINKTMRKRFPEAFEDAAEQTTEPSSKREEKPRAQKAANVVAPATRSTAPRQVRLTPSQVAIAKRLGLTNEAYARELIKLENDNG
jgi:hypothetical protein